MSVQGREACLANDGKEHAAYINTVPQTRYPPTGDLLERGQIVVPEGVTNHKGFVRLSSLFLCSIDLLELPVRLICSFALLD